MTPTVVTLSGFSTADVVLVLLLISIAAGCVVGFVVFGRRGS